jgi:inner membrane protein
MTQTIPWWVWGVAAAVIGLAELHVPGSYLIWIAIGAACTAAVAAVAELALPGELGTFIAASIVSCTAGYFVYRRFAPRDDATPLNQRNRLMIGAKGVVCAAFTNGHGKVRLGDSVWLAEGPDLSEGTPVIVKSMRGTALIVDPA